MKPSCRGGPWRRRWGNPSCSSPPTDLTIKLCDCHFVTIWLKWQSCQGHDDDGFNESHDDNQVDQNIDIQNMFLLTTFILIGHKADHCLPLSLTDSLTHSCFVNFCSDLEHKVWSRFWNWSSGKICMVKRFPTLEKSWLSCRHWLPLSLTDHLATLMIWLWSRVSLTTK